VGVPVGLLTEAVNEAGSPASVVGAVEVNVAVVAVDCTTSTRTADVLVAYFVLPEYVPVMLCDPAESVLIGSVASPELLIVAVPSTVVPSLNVTCPVKGPAPVAGPVALTAELSVRTAPA
jgi:hypothetical protein